MKATSKRAGFSLPELLVVLTILGLVSAGLAAFYRDATVMLFTSDQKLKINADVRALTNEMTDNARDANHFTLYLSFYEDFRSPSTPLTGADYRLRDAESGDFLCLVFYGTDTNPSDNVPPPIVRVVGYFRSIEDLTNNTGPVRKFDIDVPVSQQLLPIEDIIPETTLADTFPQVVELSRGLANGRLFYNYRDRSIMVNGQIFHGNAAKRVTDTYNFTISPRG